MENKPQWITYVEYFCSKYQKMTLALSIILCLFCVSFYADRYLAAIEPRVITLGNFPVYEVQKDFSDTFKENFKFASIVEPDRFKHSEGETSIRHTYIKDWSGVAKGEMESFGVPASIKLAQAILESTSGSSNLAQATNNHFAIKCKNKDCKKGKNPGHCEQWYDDHPNDRFLKFATPWWSWRAHSRLMIQDRYGNLLSHYPVGWDAVNPYKISKKDSKAKIKEKRLLISINKPKWELAVKNWNTPYLRWAYGLDAMGYATNEEYSKILINLIESENLNQYDYKYASIQGSD